MKDSAVCMEGLSMIKEKITAIVLAAGQGKRMNMPVAKQFLTLKDKPVLYYSLKAFEDSSVDDIILVTENNQVDYCIKNIIQLYGMNKVTKVIEGGLERYDSVYQAIKVVDKTNYIMIHDGARPFVTKSLIEEMIMKLKTEGACITGTPVKDTIKIVNNGYIENTPKRDTLWSAQTPQAFDFISLRNAYNCLYQEEELNRLSFTDDAMVYETYIKKPIAMVQGNYTNLKITTIEDLKIAELLMEYI